MQQAVTHVRRPCRFFRRSLAPRRPFPAESKQQGQPQANRFYEVVSGCVDEARRAGLQEVEGAAAEGDKPAIAVLLIVIDSVPFEDMWRAWAEHGKNHARIEFFIHAKHPERVHSEWARRRLVPKSFRPTWGSVQITMAMHYLLCQAYRHEHKFGHFVFASETCLPVQPVEQCVQLLREANCSWVNATPNPMNGFAQQKQFEPLMKLFPREKVYKADQWVLLSRCHAAAIVELARAANRSLTKDYVQSFSVVTASDEMYFPTTLAVLGVISTDDQTEVAVRRVTYCDWTDEHDKNIRRERSPRTFQELSEEVLQEAVREGCWFARKFSADPAVSYTRWAALVLLVDEAAAAELKAQAEASMQEERSTARGRSTSLGDGRRRRSSRSRSRSRSRRRWRSRSRSPRRRRWSRDDSRDRSSRRSRDSRSDSRDRHRNRGWR